MDQLSRDLIKWDPLKGPEEIHSLCVKVQRGEEENIPTNLPAQRRPTDWVGRGALGLVRAVAVEGSAQVFPRYVFLMLLLWGGVLLFLPKTLLIFVLLLLVVVYF